MVLAFSGEECDAVPGLCHFVLRSKYWNQLSIPGMILSSNHSWQHVAKVTAITHPSVAFASSQGTQKQH